MAGLQVFADKVSNSIKNELLKPAQIEQNQSHPTVVRAEMDKKQVEDILNNVRTQDINHGGLL